MFIVASLAVMVIHCCIWFEQKSLVVRDLGGGGGVKYFETSIYHSIIALRFQPIRSRHRR